MKKKSLTSILKITVTCVLILTASASILKVFFLKSRIVVSDSMSPTLQEGDQLICVRLAFSSGHNQPDPTFRAALKVKDIIVFKLDSEPDYLIKRVIGLPGDTVETKTDGVYINGKRLPEDYLSSDPGFADYLKCEVPPDCVFVLGDHRALSRDSRAFGVVRSDEVKEKVLFRFYPPGRIGTIR